MPADVIVRPVTDDYGIDREVEVFVDGRATGLTFKVQLKGTDKSGNSRRVKRSSVKYWHSLDVPVLLVSYEAPTGILRGRWVHSIGIDEPDSGAETVTIHMDPDIGFDHVTAESLASDLALIRAVEKGTIPVPTPIRVDVQADLGLSHSQLLAAILTLSRRTRMPMRAAHDGEAGLVVAVEKSRIRVALPLRIGSASIHLIGRAQSTSIPELAEMAMALAAISAGTVNAEQARAWLSAAGYDGGWWRVDGLHERLLPLLDHPEMADQLLRIYANLVIRDDSASMFYVMPLLDRVRDVEGSVFAEVANSLQQHLSGHPEEARLAFNLGGLYRARREFSDAAEMYELAQRRSPRYRDDPLLLRHLGAAQWELGDYNASAETYQRALARGFDPFELKPLLADSLMLAGKYSEALLMLDDWEPRGVSEDRAGLLRLVILDRLVNDLGIEVQDRDGYDQRSASASFNAATQPHPDEQRLHDTLRDFDALHWLPWSALVGLKLDDLSFPDALALAWMLNADPQAWVLALAAALANDVSEALIRAVVDQGRFHCRDEFYEATLEFADLQQPEVGDYMRELISAAYASEFVPFMNVVRMTNSDAKGNKNWVVSQEFFPPAPDNGW